MDDEEDTVEAYMERQKAISGAQSMISLAVFLTSAFAIAFAIWIPWRSLPLWAVPLLGAIGAAGTIIGALAFILVVKVWLNHIDEDRAVADARENAKRRSQGDGGGEGVG